MQTVYDENNSVLYSDFRDNIIDLRIERKYFSIIFFSLNLTDSYVAIHKGIVTLSPENVDMDIYYVKSFCTRYQQTD